MENAEWKAVVVSSPTETTAGPGSSSRPGGVQSWPATIDPDLTLRCAAMRLLPGNPGWAEKRQKPPWPKWPRSVHVWRAPHAVWGALHHRARARALLRYTHFVLCAANNAFVHARAPAHHPQPRTLIFLWRMQNERPSSSVVPQKLLPDQGRAADQAGSNPGQPRSTLISPILRRRPNGTASPWAIRKHLRAIRRRPPSHPQTASPGHPQPASPGHPQTASPGHPQTASPGHPRTASPGRPRTAPRAVRGRPPGPSADGPPGRPRTAPGPSADDPSGPSADDLRAIRRRPPGHPQTTPGPSADGLPGPSADGLPGPSASPGRPQADGHGPSASIRPSGHPQTTSGHPQTTSGHPQTTSGHPQTTSSHPQTTRLDPSALDGNHWKDGSLRAMNTQASPPRRAKSKLLPTFPVVYLRHDAKWPVTWNPSMHAGKAQMGHIRQWTFERRTTERRKQPLP